MTTIKQARIQKPPLDFVSGTWVNMFWPLTTLYPQEQKRPGAQKKGLPHNAPGTPFICPVPFLVPLLQMDNVDSDLGFSCPDLSHLTPGRQGNSEL